MQRCPEALLERGTSASDILRVTIKCDFSPGPVGKLRKQRRSPQAHGRACAGCACIAAWLHGATHVRNRRPADAAARRQSGVLPPTLGRKAPLTKVTLICFCSRPVGLPLPHALQHCRAPHTYTGQTNDTHSSSPSVGSVATLHKIV